MARYQLFFVDLDGNFEARIDLDEIDDKAAIGVARGYGDGRPMQLWQGLRLVRQFATDMKRPH